MAMREIALQGIETKANWVRDDAMNLDRFVRMLADLPEYETLAEDAVREAEMALTEALLSVKLSRSQLEKKRVMLVAAE